MDISIENRPRSRGVTQLMYVGDDDAVENNTGPWAGYKSFLDAPGGRVVKIGVAVAAAVAIFGPKKHRNKALVAGGIVAALPFMAV